MLSSRFPLGLECLEALHGTTVPSLCLESASSGCSIGSHFARQNSPSSSLSPAAQDEESLVTTLRDVDEACKVSYLVHADTPAERGPRRGSYEKRIGALELEYEVQLDLTRLCAFTILGMHTLEIHKILLIIALNIFDTKY